MNKEKFLTLRWNNLLTVVLGIPALLYVIFALTNSSMSESGSFIGLVIIGVLY